MLVRFDGDLIEALLAGRDPQPTKTSFVITMTEDGPVRMPFQVKDSGYLSDLKDAIDEMPDWLKEELAKGQIICMGKSDYAALPDSVIRFAEIMASYSR